MGDILYNTCFSTCCDWLHVNDLTAHGCLVNWISALEHRCFSEQTRERERERETLWPWYMSKFCSTVSEKISNGISLKYIILWFWIQDGGRLMSQLSLRTKMAITAPVMLLSFNQQDGGTKQIKENPRSSKHYC